MDSESSAKHVVVIVLGDVGRSPRMQYHAVSLLEEGYTVSLVGYKGVDLIPALMDTKYAHRLHVVRFQVPSPDVFKKVLPVYLIWRIFSLFAWLSWALFVGVSAAPVDCLLVQNPPALPLLLVVYLYSRIQFLVTLGKHRPAIVIDWHNLGYTMLSHRIFRTLAKFYETRLAPCADGHLCVTEAMYDFLPKNLNVKTTNLQVLYDCPPDLFQPISMAQQHEVLLRSHPQLTASCPRSWYDGLELPHQTLFTTTENNTVQPRRNRPALVTTSTSWTPDEDFDLLLEALMLLDQHILRRESDLRLLVLVTGKGPLKAHYQQVMSRLTLTQITIQTIWLSPQDYPKILACADVGISLHTSTSGLDLPMKVLDLFGCQVPVCARDFDCLKELVQDGVNGRVFTNSSQLAEQLWSLLSPIVHPAEPHSYGDLARFSNQLHGRMQWRENWRQQALPVLNKAMES